MKLHLPKVLLVALCAATSLSQALTVDSSSINWDTGSGVWKRGESGWLLGTLKSGSPITDWENGYDWADSASSPARIGGKGYILLVDGSTRLTADGITSGQGTSDGGGLVAINGASGTVSLGNYAGYIYVEKDCNVTVTWTANLKNLAANSGGYSLVANGTLTLGSDITFGGGGTDHKWFVGDNGKVTISGNFNRNGKTLDVDVEVGAIVASGTELENRQARTRNAITAESTAAGNVLDTTTVRVLDATGKVVALDGIVTKTATGISITDYERATLVWENAEEKLWTNAGSGWYKKGDAVKTDTSFLHGDNVIFEAGSSVTLGSDVTFDTMTVQGTTSVNLGKTQDNSESGYVLTGNSVNVTGGTLTLTNPKNAVLNAGNIEVKSWTTSNDASISYTGNYRIYNGETEFQANMAISGMLSVVGNSTVKVTGGNLKVAQIRLHDYSGNGYSEKMTISGGVVDVTSTNKGASTSAGILLGHWPNDNDTRALTLSGGVLNAIETTTIVGWDSKARLDISGGEANLYQLMMNPTKGGINNRNHGGAITLSGQGRLNIGAGGVCAEHASTLTVSGGTIGTLTGEWTFQDSFTLNATDAFTIDTEKRTASENGASAASGEGGNIIIAGELTGSGNLTKSGLGALTLSHANSSYSGDITVSGGSLKLTDAAALGTGALTVESKGTLVVCSGITASLNTASIAGTLELAAGSRLDLTPIAGETNTHSLSIGTLVLEGDATIGMSIDQTLLTSFSVGTLTQKSHTLTLDFSKPLTPFTEAKTQVVASGLSGNGLNLTLGGQALEKATDSDTWSAMIGRTTYTWELVGGSLTYSETASQQMNLVWNGVGGGTWAPGEAGWQTTVGGTTQSVVFENDDNVTFTEGEVSLVVADTIVVNNMRLEDGAHVILSVAEGDTASSLSAATLTLGSATGAAEPEGREITMNVNGLNATVKNLSVEAGKSATIAMGEGTTLTVGTPLSVSGANLTLSGGSVVIDAITAENGAEITIASNMTNASAMTMTAGENSSITLSGATISQSTTLIKEGVGDMSITAPLGDFAGTIDVRAGTMKIGKEQAAEGELVLPNLKLTGGTTQITGNTTLTKIIGCTKTGEGDNAAYAALTVDSGATLKTGGFEKAEYVLNGLRGEGTLEYTGTGTLTLGQAQKLETINGVFHATSAILEFNNLSRTSGTMQIEGKVSTVHDVEVVSLANLEVGTNGTLKSGGKLVLGHTVNSNTNIGTLTAKGTVTAEGGVEFRGSASTLNVKSDKVTIGTVGRQTNFTAITGSGTARLGKVVIDGGKTLKVRDSLIDYISFATTEGDEGRGKVNITAGRVLKGSVGAVSNSENPVDGLSALMSDCTLKNTDVIVSAADAIDATAIGVENFSSKVFALNIMSNVTLEVGSTFSLQLVGMENYKNVKLHWEISTSNAGSGIAPASENAESNMVNLDTNSSGVKNYGGVPFVFSSTNGAVVDVWATCEVPEPSTGTLSVLALASLCARRRRKK